MGTPHSPRNQLRNGGGHLVSYSDVDDTGMQFSLTNWRYWLIGLGVILAIAGIVMSILAAPPMEGVTDGAYRTGVMIGMGIGGLICTGFVPGIFLIAALASSSDRSKRTFFGVAAILGVAFSSFYAFVNGINIAVNGTGAAQAAREVAYKQAFDTLDSYAASADKARDAFFDAGGVSAKSLIGADTIRNRITLVNKLKTECAASAKLLENAEPALNEWFESAGVSSIGRDTFWVSRHGHEYTAALKELRAAETSLTVAVSEYLETMRRLNGHFAVAESANVWFKEQEDLDTYNAALKKLDPSLKAYKNAQERLDACKAVVKAVEAKRKK